MTTNVTLRRSTRATRATDAILVERRTVVSRATTATVASTSRSRPEDASSSELSSLSDASEQPVVERKRKRTRKSAPREAEEQVKPKPRKRKTAPASLAEAIVSDLEEPPAPAKRKRKKVVAPTSPSSYPIRFSSSWKIGAHVSAAGGVENAILNAAAIGANSFALFLKSQRKWTGPAISPESEETFKARMKAFEYDPAHVLPHGSYLVNLGNPDTEKREKSYECFLDELRRCEQLGLTLYNFHPGSTVGTNTPKHSLTLIAECINRAHKETTSVVCVLENMAGAGNVLCSTFAEIAEVIQQVEDKTRVGVCIDTCHAYSAGYDIRTKDGWNRTMEEFDRLIGLSYLRGMHLNDSKAALGSKKDRHENIGMGELGIRTFKHIVSDPRTQAIPLVLETPNFDADREVWGTEVAVLNRLSTISTSSLAKNSREGTNTVVLGDEKRSAADILAAVLRAKEAAGTKASNSEKRGNRKKITGGLMLGAVEGVRKRKVEDTAVGTEGEENEDESREEDESHLTSVNG